MDTPIDQAQAKRGFSAWHLLIIAVLIVFMVATGVVVWFVTRVTAPPLDSTITEKFTESIPTVGPSDGILETATCTVPETFTQSDSAWLFNVIPLGTTVSEIRVPAVYRYHIELYDRWKLEVQGQVCIVTAPLFRPSLPPAILTGQMVESTTAGWLRFNAADDLATLESRITEELERRADDRTHRNFVRESCRKSVARFVKAWLLKQDFWRNDRFYQVIVQFPDDPPETNGLMNPPTRPAVTFDSQPSPAQ